MRPRAYVETTLTGPSALQLEQLIRGGFDIGFQQADHVVRGVEQGADLFIFMAQGHAPDLSLVAAPGIGALDDLKGKVVGGRRAHRLRAAAAQAARAARARGKRRSAIFASSAGRGALRRAGSAATPARVRSIHLSIATRLPRASAVSGRSTSFFRAIRGW
ncbi:MAG: hypothetical protein KIT18_01140 [Burkholderiales bacterium]|nr:hypothetical protein [Burkholderiales bacterium]